MRDKLSIKIVLEGTQGGLAHGRLGIFAFSESFLDLVRGYKDIATRLILSARDDPEFNKERGQGRKPRLAELMDLEIDSITHSSPPEVCLICPVPEADRLRSNELFAEDLVRRTAGELVDSVEAEAAGLPRNKYVRRCLSKMPAGTYRQSWKLYEGSKVVKEISFGSPKLQQLELASSGFISAEGRVSGLHFSPNWEIRISQIDDSQILFKGTEEQIEQALILRNEPVIALGVSRGGKQTLLWIRAKAARREFSREQRNLHFSKRWDAVLKRLAK